MEILESFGLVGLLIICFLASSLYPLGSEVFVLGFVSIGYSESAVWCVATLGNTLGALTTYAIGYFGNDYLLNKYFKTASAKIHHYQNKIQKLGFCFAFFSFLPFIGDIFALALGVYQYPFLKATFFIALGKGFRYLVLLGTFSWWQSII